MALTTQYEERESGLYAKPYSRALVVDDKLGLLNLACEVIKDYVRDIDKANSGEEALDIYKTYLTKQISRYYYHGFKYGKNEWFTIN